MEIKMSKNKIDLSVLALLKTNPMEHGKICKVLCQGNNPNVRHIGSSLSRLMKSGQIICIHKEDSIPIFQTA